MTTACAIGVCAAQAQVGAATDHQESKDRQDKSLQIHAFALAQELEVVNAVGLSVSAQ